MSDPVTARVRYAVFTEFVRELEVSYSCSVTSWWRTPAHNATLAGHAGNSAHLVGTAVDVVFDPGHAPNPLDFTAWCLVRQVKAEDVTPATEAPAAPGQVAEHPHWHLELVQG